MNKKVVFGLTALAIVGVGVGSAFSPQVQQWLDERAIAQAQQALLSGLPSDGVFTMSLVHDQDPDSRHILFDRVAYNDLFVEPESATEHPLEVQPNDKPKGLTTEEKQRFESLVLDWSL